MKKNTVGSYGPYLASLQPGTPGALSFRHPRAGSLNAWRARARRRVLECMLPPVVKKTPRVRLLERYEWDGLHVERLEWTLPYGPTTDAIFLKPAGARGRLPGIVALHCHNGIKMIGWRKIAKGREPVPAMLKPHQPTYYGGVFWANEIARRGYAVLAHDGFTFASRRVRIADVTEPVRRGAPRPDPRTADQVGAYNQWASGHEHVLAKSLFNAGTTWPGLVLTDDQVALNILEARPDVDPNRLGCGGLSGGGLRTVLLAGLDPRIKAAVCAGLMTTWRDFSLNTSWVHSWMSHIPLIARELDFPEILGLRVPLPTLVLSTKQDALFTLPEMRRADRILKGVFRKARASANFRTSFYPGPHQFNLPMQAEAFTFFDRHLKK